MHTSADALVHSPQPKARGVFELVFGALLLVANLVLLAAAWQDKSWGAMVLAVAGGPILNSAFLFSGLLAIPFLKRRRPHFSLGRHLALTLGVPIAAAVVDFFAIMSMGLHAC
jgi:hypothetical protein